MIDWNPLTANVSNSLYLLHGLVMNAEVCHINIEASKTIKTSLSLLGLTPGLLPSQERQLFVKSAAETSNGVGLTQQAIIQVTYKSSCRFLLSRSDATGPATGKHHPPLIARMRAHYNEDCLRQAELTYVNHLCPEVTCWNIGRRTSFDCSLSCSRFIANRRWRSRSWQF